MLLLAIKSGVLGKPFQKMRRRLTVTGASETIDGGIQKNNAEEEPPTVAKKNKVRCWNAAADRQYR